MRLLLAAALALAGCGDDALSTGMDGGAPDLAAMCTTSEGPGPGVVLTDRGPVLGAIDASVWSWKGIPYAAPPTGELRFAPPAPAPYWSTLRPAMVFAAACPQVDANGNVVGNEDCLYLNVWSPDGAQSAPVLVFVHGGANVQGAASQAVYDGSLLAQRGVVVVTLDYRLDALGFLTTGPLTGNYGLLDQQAALRWVQTNIGRFGGDPSRVLLFGQSAGAVDVCAQLASPSAKGLFSAALLESGACNVNPPSSQAANVATFLQNAGCASSKDVAACLRALTPTQIITALPPTGQAVVDGVTGFAPVTDGTVLPESPILALADGTAAKVPVAIGSNADETGKAVALMNPLITDETSYQAALQKRFGALAPKVAAMYPSSSYASPEKAYVALTSDERFICSSRRAARAAAKGGLPTYRYFFTHALENGSPAVKYFGAFHGLELPFVFGTFSSEGGYVPDNAETTLSGVMQSNWMDFATDGKPAMGWPAYDPASDNALLFDDFPTVQGPIRQTQCDFWDSLLP